MITTVIFDIGNVLAAYDWEDALKRLGYSEEAREIIGNAVFRSADWNEMDRGVLTLEELLQRFIKRAPEYEKEIRQAIYNYKDMAHQYDYTKPWLKELKEKGLRLYYLSNYGEFGVQETLEALDFRELMDGGIFSYEVKMIKPSRWIFEELLYRYKLNREEAVFFDDSAANAEAACQVGLHGIQFTGYEDARQKLESLLAR